MTTERHSIRVHTETGDYFDTDFNGTKEQIIEYYVGKVFNIGYCPINEDRLEKCVKVEFLDMNNKISINLDDEQTVEDFLKNYGCSSKRKIANSLGLSGKGSFKAAQSLKNYAINKITAMRARKNGNISTAIRYEEICDRIYREDIEGKEICW